MSNSQVAAEGGFGGLLSAMQMNTVEFGLCAGFWVVVLIVSSFISLEQILGAP